MGVYIKGMEMPPRCYTCPCADLEFFDCNLLPGTRIEQHKRLDNCPLIPVPPHGRLGDLDALAESVTTPSIFPPVVSSEVLAFLRDAPTVIPTEEGE